jgi:hypothetical protein
MRHPTQPDHPTPFRRRLNNKGHAVGAFPQAPATRAPLPREPGEEATATTMLQKPAGRAMLGRPKTLRSLLTT